MYYENYVNTGYLIGAFFAATAGWVINQKSLQQEKPLILATIAGIAAIGIGYLIGKAIGYGPGFLGLAVFESVRASYSIMLNLWAFRFGFSPLQYKIFQIAITIFSFIDICILGEAFFWLTCIVAIVQTVCDFALLPFVSRYTRSHYGWTFFSSGWVSTLTITTILTSFICAFAIDIILAAFCGALALTYLLAALYFYGYDDNHTSFYLY